ncbi:OLC1v1007271C1 [Oldenlandia corymbosa var. corymbosa]|uniref:OLC1v1007271C1 n=1 Tax=Oldenlandia corymbosa var. corymbosa TaxID=529605 RepID=A0AAV1DJ55_OLDCO|nr:OLC1v1007271C1 [Oldenlandia corymbosa var. corymbosa]
MKVHPVPRKRNIAFRYDIASSLSQANAIACRQKKLRRLPHIFAKVLELPFHSDADVSIEETASYLRFVVSTDDVGNDVRAHTLEIYPGVTKILIRENDDVGSSLVDELEFDMWRFRLPASTVPEMATAAYTDGELVVTVPKGGDGVDNDEAEDGDIGGGAGHLVLVQ